jgi:hypothetical protein
VSDWPIEPELDARLRDYFERELRQADLDVSNIQPRLALRPGVRPGLAAASLALLVVLAMLGLRLASVAPAPGALGSSALASGLAPTASPPVPVASDGLPISINGAPVLRVPEAIEQASNSTDATPFLVAGWLDPAKPSCLVAFPTVAEQEPCTNAPALMDRPALGTAVSAEPSQSPVSLLWPVALDSSVLDGVPGDLAVVLSVHTHDPSASTCSAALRAMCEQTVVIDSVAWQSPGAPSAPLGIVFGSNGLPTSINGEPVLSVDGAFERQTNATDSTPFLVAGSLESVVIFCPLLPQQPALLEGSRCNGPVLLGGGGYGPAELWPVYLTELNLPDAVPGVPIPVVLRVHTHDPAASACPAVQRGACERAVVADALVWSAAPSATPDPSR